MTRAEFIQRLNDRIAGPVFDVLLRGAQGGELSMLVRRMMRQIDDALGSAYDALHSPPHGQPNGQPSRVVAKT